MRLPRANHSRKHLLFASVLLMFFALPAIAEQSFPDPPGDLKLVVGVQGRRGCRRFWWRS